MPCAVLYLWFCAVTSVFILFCLLCQTQRFSSKRSLICRNIFMLWNIWEVYIIVYNLFIPIVQFMLAPWSRDGGHKSWISRKTRCMWMASVREADISSSYSYVVEESDQPHTHQQQQQLCTTVQQYVVRPLLSPPCVLYTRSSSCKSPYGMMTYSPRGYTSYQVYAADNFKNNFWIDSNLNLYLQSDVILL